MWDLSFTFDADSPAPLFKQIIRAISADIARGRLQPGDALPGSRKLASQLGVHRNTVVAAYEGLVSEGWVVTRPAGGTYVADALPDPDYDAPQDGQHASFPPSPGYPLRDAGAPLYGWQRLPPFTAQVVAAPSRDMLSMAAGVCDWRLFPAHLLARALRHVTRRYAAMALTLGDPAGHPRTLHAVTTMLAARRGLVANPENIIITRGNAMNLRLLAEVAISPGEAVAVETPGFPGAWEALHQAGVRLVPIPVDERGIRIDLLSAQIDSQRIRAVYVTPHQQFPTTAVLSTARRTALMAVAADRRLMVIEDDYDHEFRFEGQQIRPLASADPAGNVVYLGSFSKLAAPGLRLGFIAGPAALVQRLAACRVTFDLQGDRILELAVADLAEEGEMGRHVRKVRSVYQQRRDALVAALRKHLPDAVTFTVPQGGVSLWTRVTAPVDVEAWAEACLTERVRFFTGRRFAFNGESSPHMRLCYASLTEEQLDEAVRRLARGLRRVLPH